MFDVSRTDARLPNKAEVLALRLARPSSPDAEPVAISADLLRQRPVYHVEGADPPLVVITSRAGANRVYQSGPRRFVSLDDEGRVLDSDRRAWIVEEDALRSTSDPSVRLPRVPAHRAFWFGWYAQHPDTLLIKD
jgi:hypothetical protein